MLGAARKEAENGLLVVLEKALEVGWAAVRSALDAVLVVLDAVRALDKAHKKAMAKAADMALAVVLKNAQGKGLFAALEKAIRKDLEKGKKKVLDAVREDGVALSLGKVLWKVLLTFWPWR